MAYLGKTLETPCYRFTIDAVRLYLVECEDCGPVNTFEDDSVPETRADALKLQREHYEYHKSLED